MRRRIIQSFLFRRVSRQKKSIMTIPRMRIIKSLLFRRVKHRKNMTIPMRELRKRVVMSLPFLTMNRKKKSITITITITTTSLSI